MTARHDNGGAGERMVLRASLTSPFGRKVRMAAILLGLADGIDIVFASTTDAADTIRTQNPLGKIPCLLLETGATLYDSRVIAAYLCALVPGQTLLPLDPRARALEETRTVLADGIADAGLLLVYEDRFRAPEQRSEIWVEHQRGKIERALPILAADLPPAGSPTLSSLALASALGYLDWRKQMDWRPAFPALVGWLAAFERLNPALAATAPQPDSEGP